MDKCNNLRLKSTENMIVWIIKRNDTFKQYSKKPVNVHKLMILFKPALHKLIKSYSNHSFQIKA